MRSESGRSLIEVVGVLAITGVMAAASIGMYSMIRNNQAHSIAGATLEQLVRDTKLLFEPRGSYEGVSVSYLVKAGALKTEAAPIGDDTWSVTPSFDGTSFSINLVNLSKGDCAYFATATPTWASAVLVNGSETDPGSHCFSSNTNQVSVIVE